MYMGNLWEIVQNDFTKFEKFEYLVKVYFKNMDFFNSYFFFIEIMVLEIVKLCVELGKLAEIV